MAEPHVVSALKDQYARLTGELAACEARAEVLRSLIGHVGETLKLYASDPLAIPSIRPSNKGRWFKQGQGARAVLDVLRAAEKPLTQREIANRVMLLHGLGEPARQSVRVIVQYVLKRYGADVVGDGGAVQRWLSLRS